MNAWEALAATVGMAAISLLCRSFFLLPRDDLPMPRWLREGLRFAPVAALTAVVMPELVMTQGHLVQTWRDARLFGALAGLAWYAWRRDLFGTIVCGTAVMLVLKFLLNW